MIYPPEIKILPEAVALSKRKLAELGPMSIKEWLMVGVFAILLILWMFGEAHGINAAMAALLGFCIILLLDIINWQDVLNEHDAWHTLVWLAILVTMSTCLDKFGFISWFSNSVGHLVSSWSWQTAFLALSLSYFYSHYFFASNTAHVSSMYAAFLGVSIMAGAPALLAALVLGFFSSLFSSMTHYGTSSAAVIFGSGYVPLGIWWRNGHMACNRRSMVENSWNMVGANY